MIRFVHQNSKFEKQLNALRKAGKKAAIAAKEADAIIDMLLMREDHVPARVGVPTRYGELRIRNCVKYDLGSGYRLITVRQDTHLFLLCIGTHDECDRWLENNRKRQTVFVKNRKKTFSVRKLPFDFTPNLLPESESDDHEEFFNDIDEKYLRVIFRGICGG